MSQSRSNIRLTVIVGLALAGLCIYWLSGALLIHYHLVSLRTNLYFADVAARSRPDTLQYQAARILGFLSGKRSSNDWAPAWLDHFRELTRLGYFVECEIPFTNKNLTCRQVYVATWQTLPVGTAIWDVYPTQSVVRVTAHPRDLPKWRAVIADLDKRL